MNMYWVYDLPNWLFGTLTVVVFVVIGLAGLYVTRNWARRLHIVDHSHNDIVGFYLAGVTVLYGITLALLAVGTWTTYSEVQSKIDREATSLGSLYRDISAYPEPLRTSLRDDLRRYTRQVIDVGWPMQRRGIVPNDETAILKAFQDHLMSFEPATERQKILAVEAYTAYTGAASSSEQRNRRDARATVDTRHRRGADLHRRHLVLSYQKLRYAFLDDNSLFRPPRVDDLPDRGSR